ncbi:unnamed protein product [Porites evermanni]|uniref:Gustatory receptor n=1 Tax=Porites evermanni TaxID=104178 RepID=A0ABN8Q4H6_9CNID|nr:unnamed protein product [Porites evermanni]
MTSISDRTTQPMPVMEMSQFIHGSINRNADSNDIDETDSICETESGTLAVELVEKRTEFAFRMLKLLGLATSERSTRIGRLYLVFAAVVVWLPPLSLSICVAKNPTMSSPTGLPTVLLFSGLALSHNFGALYGYRHRGRLLRNIYLAFERDNLGRSCVIVTSIFGILTLPYLVLLIYLYVTQSSRPVPWLHICIVYFLGYIFCGMASVATNLTFSAACSTINLRILNFKTLFRGWSKGLTEALNEYQGLCDFMDREVEDIKWWLLVNFISFLVIWLVNLHLWQILASGEGDVVRLVFYNCSWSEPSSAPKLHIPDRLITACEMFFSSLVFFFFMSPMFWAAMVTVNCNRFRQWINRTRVHTDERPKGLFSVTSLDFFINRVQMDSYFAFTLFGVSVTKVLISTGLMTTVQFVLGIASKKLLPA